MSSALFGRVLHAMLALVSLAIAITSVRLINRRVDYKLEAKYSQQLRLLETMDAELNAQVLATRSNLSYRYDSLSERVKAINDLQQTLRQVPNFLGPAPALDLRAQLDQYATLSRNKSEAIEKFKSYYALLRNSLHYFPTAASFWVGAPTRTNRRIARSVQAAVSALLTLEVMPTRDDWTVFERATQDLVAARWLTQNASDAENLDLLARHARIILARKPEVDQLIKTIVAMPTLQTAARLAATYSTYYQGKLDVITTQQHILLMLIVGLVGCALLEVIRKQQIRSIMMAETSNKLASANAALSRERERERELSRLKSQFVSMTSHEFRTPLAGIISSSELLEKYATRWDAERVQNHLTRIKTVAQHMSRMLEEMLLIGRADAGMLRPAPKSLNLDDYCRQLIATITRTHDPPKTIEYTFCGQSRVWLDERLLTHVLSNLLENACKYSPEGESVALAITCNDASCRIVVHDNGIGIPPDELGLVFEGFHRAANVGRIPGTGLGLAVVKRSVEVQGGSIFVSSELGRGTTFQVQFPAPVDEANLPEVTHT